MVVRIVGFRGWKAVRWNQRENLGWYMWVFWWVLSTYRLFLLIFMILLQVQKNEILRFNE
jgi:hypothetical protein